MPLGPLGASLGWALAVQHTLDSARKACLVYSGLFNLFVSYEEKGCVRMTPEPQRYKTFYFPNLWMLL
jgi:hypothetical protein